MNISQYFKIMAKAIPEHDVSEKFAKNLSNPLSAKNKLVPNLCDKNKIIYAIMCQIKYNQYKPEDEELYKNDINYYLACNMLIQINTIICIHSIRNDLIACDPELSFEFIYDKLVKTIYEALKSNNEYIDKAKIYKLFFNSYNINKLSRIATFNLINKNNLKDGI